MSNNLSAVLPPSSAPAAHAGLAANGALAATQAILHSFSNSERMHAGSVLVSLFGDTVVPRGGRIWLGSLIRLLEPLGLSERLVRTAVFRLVRSDWLQSQRVGRRTDYLLTPSAVQRISEAAALIYASTAPDWDRRWRLIMVVGELPAKDRERLHKALSWHGFGALNNGCFIHPSADLVAALESLASEGLSHLSPQLKPLIAADIGLDMAATEAAMAGAAWNLERLAVAYQGFVNRYAPILQALRQDAGEPLDDETAFLLRLLLVHDYRHLLLRDPVLPEVLLPTGWSGQQARNLCRDLYRRLLPAAERHLDQHLQLADGSSPPAGCMMAGRFSVGELLV